MAFNNDEITPMIDKIIYNWVRENFGEAEALDPSWSIIELAHEIAAHKRDIWQAVEREFVKEGIKLEADGWNNGEGVTLTDAEVDAIADEYMESDDYTSIDPAIRYYIEDELKRRK